MKTTTSKNRRFRPRGLRERGGGGETWFNLRMTPDLKQELEAIAFKTGCSLSILAREALRRLAKSYRDDGRITVEFENVENGHKRAAA